MTAVKDNEVPLTHQEAHIYAFMGFLILTQVHLSYSLPGCLIYLLKMF